VTLPRTLKIASIVLAAAILATVPGAWSRLRSDPDRSLRFEGGRQVGDVRGYIVNVDPAHRALTVSVDRLGIRTVPLTISDETTIIVQGRLGGVGDLWTDLPVFVAYELRDGARLARSIAVSGGERPRASATVVGPSPAAAAPDLAVGGEATGVSAGRADPEPVDSRGPAPRASTAAPADVDRAVVTTPAREGPTARPTPSVERTSRASTPRRQAPTNPPVAPGGGEDGTAAIDWLFRERPR